MVRTSSGYLVGSPNGILMNHLSITSFHPQSWQKMSKKTDEWLRTPGKDGRKHKDSAVRIVMLPPFKSDHSWSVEGYKERWDLIEEKLGAGHQ